MKSKLASKKFSFQSKLESISTEAEYFALSVPLKITQALGTRSSVPVMAKVNDSKAFRISLFPVGGGRHYIRIKAEVRKEVNIKGGDRVRVQITVIDRTTETSMPKDLMRALREDGVVDAFKSLPPGKLNYMIRWIEDAARPETREKRVQAAVKAAHDKSDKKK